MEDNHSYLHEDLLAQIPFELQVLIFSRIKLQDLVRFASTSHFWNINAWAFAMSLAPNEFSDVVIKVADEASYDPMVETDLFSDPVPPPTIEAKPQKEFKLFHFLFQKVELSPQKVSHFEIEETDGFAEIKDEFIDALTMYPGFLNEIRSLKVSKLRLDDIQRLLWYTSSLKTLEIVSERVDQEIPANHYKPVAMRNPVPLALFNGIDFSNCPNLEVLACRGFSVVETDVMNLFKTAKNLKALIFSHGEFNLMTTSGRTSITGDKLTYLAIRDSLLKSKFDRVNEGSFLFNICSQLKTLDLRACTYGFGTYPNKESAHQDAKILFPQADVLVDENDYYEFDLNE